MTKTALVVDDSVSLRQMVSFTLKEAGFGVIEAEDGRDGLAKLSGPVNVVVTDLNMPNMNGIEMIRGIRAIDLYKFTPILMLTTESQPAKKQEGKEAGATGWIIKPFTPEKLLGVIKKVVR